MQGEAAAAGMPFLPMNVRHFVTLVLTKFEYSEITKGRKNIVVDSELHAGCASHVVLIYPAIAAGGLIGFTPASSDLHSIRF